MFSYSKQHTDELHQLEDHKTAISSLFLYLRDSIRIEKEKCC